jgi:hypothetical protein
MFDSIFTTTDAETVLSLPGMLIALGVAFVLGMAVSLVYMKTQKNRQPSESFALTLVILPVVISVIILLVGNNVARAFSLAGAFSIIRFRSAPGNPKDITYVLLCMAVGLATGMGFVAYAVVVALILCGIMLLLELTKFGQSKGQAKTLKITIPEDLNYEHSFDDILAEYTQSSTLRKVRTMDLGSLFELNYSVTMKKDVSEKAFLDEIRSRNGNLNINLVLDAPSDEF